MFPVDFNGDCSCTIQPAMFPVQFNGHSSKEQFNGQCSLYTSMGTVPCPIQWAMFPYFVYCSVYNSMGNTPCSKTNVSDVSHTILWVMFPEQLNGKCYLSIQLTVLPVLFNGRCSLFNSMGLVLCPSQCMQRSWCLVPGSVPQTSEIRGICIVSV